MVRLAGGLRRRNRNPPRLRTRFSRVNESIGQLGAAIMLGWRAAPWTLPSYAAAQAVAGGLPVVNAWLVRDAIDRLVSEQSRMNVIIFALAFSAVALVRAVSSPVLRYLTAELTRSVEARAKDELYTALP